MDAVARAERNKIEPDILPGTLGAIISAYRASPEFRSLRERTQRDYQNVLNFLVPLAQLPLTEIGPRQIYEIRDAAFERKKRRFANYVLQVLSRIFNWGKSRGFHGGNPAEGVERVRRPRDSKTVNRRWTDAEFETVLTNAKGSLRLGIALGGYLGFRLGDVLSLQWSAYQDGAFEIRQRKTGESLWVPVHNNLKLLLANEIEHRNSTLLVATGNGRPYKIQGFQSMFFRLIRSLTKQQLIQPGLSFHGLRHTVGTKLAEAGCDARTIAAMLGHSTTHMAEHYSRNADRKELVRDAVHRLEQRARNA